MSNPAVLFSQEASRVFVEVSNARSLKDRVGILSALRPRDLVPNAPSVVEPSTGLSMGEHTEITVKAWGIGREAQDALAYASHQNAAAATEDGNAIPLGQSTRASSIRLEARSQSDTPLRPRGFGLQRRLRTR